MTVRLFLWPLQACTPLTLCLQQQMMKIGKMTTQLQINTKTVLTTLCPSGVTPLPTFDTSGKLYQDLWTWGFPQRGFGTHLFPIKTLPYQEQENKWHCWQHLQHNHHLSQDSWAWPWPPLQKPPDERANVPSQLPTKKKIKQMLFMLFTQVWSSPFF